MISLTLLLKDIDYLQGGWLGKGFGIVNYDYFKTKLAKRYNAVSKNNVSISTHVSQGICIPLEVKHDLARKVITTRRIC